MKLYENNRIDGEYELTVAEIAAGFWEWHGTGPVGAPLERLIYVYIGAPKADGGLQSVMDSGPNVDERHQFRLIYDAVRAAWPEVSK